MARKLSPLKIIQYITRTQDPADLNHGKLGWFRILRIHHPVLIKQQYSPHCLI